MSGRLARLLGLSALGAAALLAFTISGSSAQEGGTAQNVSVRMAEFNFGMPTRLQPGRVNMRIWNSGRFNHNFTIIEGPRKFASQTLAGNKTQNFAATLTPGAYLAICTVRNGGHMRDGMVITFTVGTQNATTGEWSR
jgi:plastocyanin